ncbi:MAG TPA: hypothetical protein V6C82_07725 [Chroococcales cyanobacterium]
MKAMTPAGFIEERGIWGWLYYLIFPLDFFLPSKNPPGADFQETKYQELFPIFLWLLPLAVLLTNTVAIGAGGMFFLYAFLAAALSLLSAFHLRLEAGQGIEILLNLLAGLIGISLALYVLAFLLGVFIENEL